MSYNKKICVRFLVSNDDEIGRLIGFGGEVIRELRYKTKTSIEITRKRVKFRIITITGIKYNVLKAIPYIINTMNTNIIKLLDDQNNIDNLARFRDIICNLGVRVEPSAYTLGMSTEKYYQVSGNKQNLIFGVQTILDEYMYNDFSRRYVIERPFQVTNNNNNSINDNNDNNKYNGKNYGNSITADKLEINNIDNSIKITTKTEDIENILNKKNRNPKNKIIILVIDTNNPDKLNEIQDVIRRNNHKIKDKNLQFRGYTKKDNCHNKGNKFKENLQSIPETSTIECVKDNNHDSNDINDIGNENRMHYKNIKPKKYPKNDNINNNVPYKPAVMINNDNYNISNANYITPSGVYNSCIDNEIKLFPDAKFVNFKSEQIVELKDERFITRISRMNHYKRKNNIPNIKPMANFIGSHNKVLKALNNHDIKAVNSEIGNEIKHTNYQELLQNILVNDNITCVYSTNEMNKFVNVNKKRIQISYKKIDNQWCFINIGPSNIKSNFNL